MVLRGECKRLMIFAPPQVGKSELFSVRFPALWLGNRPDDPVILTSYGASLAYSKSRQARHIVESQEFAELFPGVRTRTDSRAVDHWEIEGRRGGLLAAGVGGPITGHGALLGVIDDPVENWEQAQSKTYRDNVWEWYRSTFRTRIWETGAIVLGMSRWHEDDLAGRLLKHNPGQWTVLRLPAIADEGGDPLGREPGEALAPLRFSVDELRSIRDDVGPLIWEAEYQGRPTVATGSMFKQDRVEIVDAAPAAMTAWVRWWDLAATKDAGDYSVGALLGKAGDYYYVLDVVRGQWDAAECDRMIKQTAALDKERHPDIVIWIEQEPGSAGKRTAGYLISMLAGYAVNTEPSTGSKTVRATPFSSQWEVGNVKLLKGAWNRGYLDEMRAFPNGRHDDQVDASSGAFLKLTERQHESGVIRYA